MATKKSEILYSTLRYEVNDFPSCCGICVVSEFTVNTAWGRLSDEKYTAKQQAQEVYPRIVDSIQNFGATTALIALVSNYRGENTGQLPELEKELQKQGWQINQVAINGKTGNEITLYSKHFPEWVDEFLRENLDEDD